MSKKKNKKFKKVNSTAAAFRETTREPETVGSVEGDTADVAVKNAPILQTEIDPRYQMIRKGVRKVLTTVAALLIVLFGTYLLGLKTGTLASLGEWIYKIANIQSL